MLLNNGLRAFASVVAIAQTAMGISDSPSALSPNGNSAFSYNRTDFLLHGESFRIIGGQMDPQRIPHQFWRDRLATARAMGINTIFTYPFWNLLEPKEGDWRSHEPQNDIATFFRTAQEEGLYVVLRPGPYICGERDWGGFPAWLSEVPNLVVRTDNGPFLKRAENYLQKLANTSGLAELQISRGGPILMVQVENEYGSYGENHDYMLAMRDIVRENFKEITLYTNDGGGADWTLIGGQVPDVLAAVDGGSYALPSRDLYITDRSSLGPLLDGEYYTWTFDLWGPNNKHNTPDAASIQGILDDIPYHFANWSASISFYMIHGGTNFGFGNGALWQNRTSAFISSYDYASPIDETGRTTELYHKMRKTILPFVSNNESIPEPPENLPRATVPEFNLTPYKSLFDFRGATTSSKSPVTMEALGQSYGYILYEHTATATVQGKVQPGDRARDRVIVYVNEKVQGVIDSQYQWPQNISVSLHPGDKLQLLIENLGRVDYYSRGNTFANHVIDPWKGVVGNVSIGGEVLTNWDIYSMQLDSIPFTKPCKAKSVEKKESDAPMFYEGSFIGPLMTHNSAMTLDTFITVPNGIKGNVWVNGFNLGRYWYVGPQQSLYLPGSLVKPEEKNEVVILELEPWQMETPSMVAYGTADRVWGNSPDVDCLDCN